MAKDTTYQTVTGRRLDLKECDNEERAHLSAVLKKYRSKPDWNQFSSWRWNYAHSQGISSDSIVNRICDDLEVRLGISQGKMELPTYRDYLAVLIEEQYGSRYNFCQKHGIDQGQLSKIISGKADPSIDLLQRMATLLQANIVLKKEESLKSSISPDEAVNRLKELGL